MRLTIQELQGMKQSLSRDNYLELLSKNIDDIGRVFTISRYSLEDDIILSALHKERSEVMKPIIDEARTFIKSGFNKLHTYKSKTVTYDDLQLGPFSQDFYNSGKLKVDNANSPSGMLSLLTVSFLVADVFLKCGRSFNTDPDRERFSQNIYMFLDYSEVMEVNNKWMKLL